MTTVTLRRPNHQVRHLVDHVWCPTLIMNWEMLRAVPSPGPAAPGTSNGPGGARKKTDFGDGRGGVTRHGP
jgi:hypothetical protein